MNGGAGAKLKWRRGESRPGRTRLKAWIAGVTGVRSSARSHNRRSNSRFRLTSGAPAAARVLRAGPWGRRRHGAPIYGRGCSGARRPRRRDPALPVSVHGKGIKRPEPPTLAQATVRAAVAEAARLLPRIPLFAGGKSFGGRMTSQAQAAAPLPGVCGLIFLGFPLHPAGRPSQDRARHLFDISIPMLFVQGSRDSLANLGQLEPLCQALGSRAVLQLYRDADHSFHVPARAGRTDAQVRAEMLDALAGWISGVIGDPTTR